MKGIEFEYQCYYKKWLCALPLLILVICINPILIKLFGSNFMFYLMTGALMVISLMIYYKATENKFIKKGKYRIENGKLIIKLQNKTYTFEEINEVIGLDKSIYSHKFAELSITGNIRIKLFSAPLNRNENFSSSSLSQMYFDIKNSFASLKPVQVSGDEASYWLKTP